MKNKQPLLYYKTKDDIERYRILPVELKFEWLEAQMEFFYETMPEEAKCIREKIREINTEPKAD